MTKKKYMYNIRNKKTTLNIYLEMNTKLNNK